MREKWIFSCSLPKSDTEISACNWSPKCLWRAVKKVWFTTMGKVVLVDLKFLKKLSHCWPPYCQGIKFPTELFVCRLNIALSNPWALSSTHTYALAVTLLFITRQATSVKRKHWIKYNKFYFSYWFEYTNKEFIISCTTIKYMPQCLHYAECVFRATTIFLDGKFFLQQGNSFYLWNLNSSALADVYLLKH